MSRGTTAFDRTTRSVGLGLYIVDEIVRRHGGSVAVHSTEDDGTTFTIALPYAAPPRAASR
jgi:signal transduction histidine kinase